MTQFFWQIPTGGDARYADAETRPRGERTRPRSEYLSEGVSDPRQDRFNYFDHLHQVAKAAELAGFDGVRIPNDPNGEESWIVAGYVTRNTRRLTVLTDFDSARGSAVYAAKNAVSFQRFSGGRFAWHIGTTSDAQQRRQQGDFIADADIATRTEEFVTVARNVITQQNYSFKGQFFEVLEGGFKGPLSGQQVPAVYLDGNAEADFALSARIADVHVLSLAAGLDVAAAVTAIHAAAAQEKRPLAVALRVNVLARETADEARFDAQRQLEQSGHGKDIQGASLIWQGLALSDRIATATLVGQYEEIVAQLVTWANAGVDTFILGGVPSLEEAYRVGEIILPAVRQALATGGRRAA